MNSQPLVLSDIANARRMLERRKRRRLSLILVGYGSFGVVAGLLVYFLAAQHQMSSSVILGAACAILSGAPAALHWSRRHRTMARELDAIEADVSAGKVIYNTQFEIMARNAAG